MSSTYESMTYKEVKTEASLKNIKGRSSMTKDEIIDALNNYDSISVNFTIDDEYYPINEKRLKLYMKKNEMSVLNFQLDLPFAQPIDQNFGLTKNGQLNAEFQKFLLSKEFIDTVNFAMKEKTAENLIKKIVTDREIKPQFTFKLAEIDPPAIKSKIGTIKKNKNLSLFCGQKKEKLILYYENLLEKKKKNKKLKIGSFTNEENSNAKYPSEKNNIYWEKTNCKNGIDLANQVKKNCKIDENYNYFLIKLISKSHVALYIFDCKRRAIYSMDSQLVTNNTGMDYSLKEAINFFLDEEIELLDVFTLCNCPKIKFQEKTLFCQTWTIYLTMIFLLNPELIDEGPGRIFNYFDDLDIMRHFLIVQLLFYTYKNFNVEHDSHLANQQKIRNIKDADIVSNISYLFVKYSR